MPSPTYLLGPDVEKTKSAEEHCPIVQQFEISDPIAKACWYKDGTQIYPKMEVDCQSQSSSQVLNLPSHDLSGDERFDCETCDDSQSNVDMKGGVPQCACTIRIKNLVTYVKLSPSSLFSLWLCPNSRAVSLW